MRTRPKLLVAARPNVAVALRGALGEYVHMTSVYTFSDAIKLLQAESDVAMVLCSVYFDESQMFDLLRVAKEKFPATPFVCCRVLESDLARISIDALTIAAASLGAAAFIDMPRLTAEFGPDAADQQFRSRILAHLPARI
jgi:DNA-binding NarL/FixJ family response regulator